MAYKVRSCPERVKQWLRLICDKLSKCDRPKLVNALKCVENAMRAVGGATVGLEGQPTLGTLVQGLNLPKAEASILTWYQAYCLDAPYEEPYRTVIVVERLTNVMKDAGTYDAWRVQVMVVYKTRNDDVYMDVSGVCERLDQALELVSARMARDLDMKDWKTMFEKAVQ